jgi:acylphosphatase
MRKLLHAFYSGTVQGVGFRFTAEAIAVRLKVSGWVKNLSDGRVEINAEAQEESLKDFLDQINSAFNRHIQDVEVNWGPAKGEFKDFRIRF